MRCVECRGAGFRIRNGHGEGCPSCAGTGVVQSSKDIPQAVRDALATRSGGICEVCHAAVATDAHHRQYRSRGGRHLIQNLVHVCGPGNAFGCHGDAHGSAPLEGVSINSWMTDPARIPFIDKLGVRWVLHPDGTKAVAA